MLAEAARPAQTRPDQTRAGQGRAGQGRAGQGRAGQDIFKTNIAEPVCVDFLFRTLV